MRIVIIFCLIFCAQVWGGEIENALKSLHLTPKAQESLKGAMAEFYAQKRAYQQNNSRIRNKLLLDSKSQEKPDYTQYERAFQENSQEYIKAKIVFYRAIAEILDAEEIDKILERIW